MSLQFIKLAVGVVINFGEVSVYKVGLLIFMIALGFYFFYPGKSTQFKEVTNEVLGEWNGVVPGKTTKDEILQRWPDCSIEEKNVPSCELIFEEGPFANVRFGWIKDTVKVIRVYINPNSAKSYIDELFSKYGEASENRGATPLCPDIEESRDSSHRPSHFIWSAPNRQIILCTEKGSPEYGASYFTISDF